MTIGRGIAVAGIWFAVSAIGWQEPGAGAFTAIVAAAVTLALAGKA